VSRFKLCPKDPLVNTLRATFGANPVRIPELRIQPLCVVAAKGDKAAFRGDLKHLVLGDFKPPKWAKTESPMADVRTNRSGRVDFTLGMDILDKFLSGFGVPAPEISACFEGVKEVEFSFGDVVRNWVDDNWLGRALEGRSINLQNPAARIYIDEPGWRLLVINSVIRSRDFTITVKRRRSKSVGIDLGAIGELVGKAKSDISVSFASSSAVTFTGPHHLTFAFTTLEFHLDDSGAISAMPPGSDWTTLAVEGGDYVPTPSPWSIELSEGPAMIEWDDLEPIAGV